MDLTTVVLYCIISFVVAVVISGFTAFKLGINYRKKIAESEIGTAEEESKKILIQASKEAETKKKEAVLEVKDEIYRLRTEAEKEIKERRSEISLHEKRLIQKEESLDTKVSNIEKKENTIQLKMVAAEQKLQEAEDLKLEQTATLEKISSLSSEQAKKQLIDSLQDDLIHEKSIKITAYEQDLKEECDTKARNYISLAIARLAAEHVTETAVSVVTLPNDEMKGRIIGREGRNIRAIETLTGVDLIIDDTPEAITLSCFDPVRREIARLTLEKLILDGRIHPSRIEEMVEKSKRDVELAIKADGERAVLETNVHGLHPEIIKIIGRLRYRTSYGQNILNHSIEVAHLAGMLAAELGVDQAMARRAGLLHDIGKALNHEIEGSHVAIGIDVCKKFKENPIIIHAIEAHHGDVEIETELDAIVLASDAISAARPAARRENLQNYIKRLEKLEEIASSFDGVEKCFAIQAGREIRILVSPEHIKDEKMVVVARDIVNKIESELQYPGTIKVHLIRESRTIEFAK